MNLYYRLIRLALLTGWVCLCQCKSSGLDPAPDIDLNKTWKASEVKEGGTVVYKAGGTANIYPGYSKFRMVFEPAKVTYTEFTGDVFSGNWTLDSGGKKLTFQGLNPVPFGTNATIEYTLVSWSQSQLILQRTTPNPKTGNSLNEYTLIPE